MSKAPPPWFDPKWRERYAKALREMQWLEKLAKLCGRIVRPKP